jgi:hypothetical protein
MALRILIALLILAVPLELPGCGPFLPEALFFLKTAPESPKDFARGQLGVLQPTYEHLYQVMAYRWLAGVGMNDGEQQAVLPPPPQGWIDHPAPTVTPNPWLAARNQVPGVQPLKEIDPYRQVQQRGFFNEYLNCNDDAFRTAASTLERVRSKPFATDWIAAQDIVFADCSNGADIPQPASDPQLRPDRIYQIASAKFYSEKYDDARQDFQAIASDASSPWQDIAPYLAARCLIRAGKLAEAETELQRIAADPARVRWHGPANGLLGYVRLRLNPPERMHELGLALMRPNSQATIGQDLIDYRQLWDQNVKPAEGDDLTDWIRDYQANGKGLMEKWRAVRTLPWLVAALHYVDSKDPNAAELLAAAAAVKPDSPGYLTVTHDRIRLLPPEEGRALADQLLAGNLPTAVQNQIRAERMELARDFDEFLRYAPRRAVAEVTDNTEPVDDKVTYLDSDSADVFNQALPLAYWKRAQSSPLLPDHVRKELQRLIFVRTLLMSDAPPFDQVFTVLHSPGMQLNLTSGYGRNTAEIDKIDNYRDNWWCSADLPSPPYYRVQTPPPAPPNLPFPAEGVQKEAAAEALKLRAAGAAPDWLGAQTIAFAQRHPQDPRVPEALYLVVRASRYGCTDAKTGEYSKGAFDLLHQRYPNSEWTKKTPFWFK